MGKLGAQELNLSSDIDLIFAFDEGGETNGKKFMAKNQLIINSFVFSGDKALFGCLIK